MTPPSVRRWVRALALIYAVPGVGFVVSTVAALVYDQRQGELPMTPFGFRLMESYPAIASISLTPLGRALALLLVAVSFVEIVIGVLLWQGRAGGAILALGTAPVSLVLGIVFALPYLLVMAPFRAVAAAVALRELRRGDLRSHVATRSHESSVS